MITLLDYVEHKVGPKPSYTMADTDQAGVPFFGGCQTCQAAIAAYNAAPTRNGYIKCLDCCTESEGFASVLEFEAWCVEQDKQATTAEDGAQ